MEVKLVTKDSLIFDRFVRHSRWVKSRSFFEEKSLSQCNVSVTVGGVTWLCEEDSLSSRVLISSLFKKLTVSLASSISLHSNIARFV